MQAYGAVDADGSRFLLSDYLGNLYLLLLLREDGAGGQKQLRQKQLLASTFRCATATAAFRRAGPYMPLVLDVHRSTSQCSAILPPPQACLRSSWSLWAAPLLPPPFHTWTAEWCLWGRPLATRS